MPEFPRAATVLFESGRENELHPISVAGQVVHMPELPEVETVRRGLAQNLGRATIVGVEVREHRLRRPVPVSRVRALVGSRLSGYRRRAKYLLLDTDADTTLIVHLGMSGRLVTCPVSESTHEHDHVCFRLRREGEEASSDRELRLRDPRRFGLIDVVETAVLPRHSLMAHLGPEPLGPNFDVDYLVATADGRRRPIKNLLMDAEMVVGIGNIYANEALWEAGIHPRRAAGRIARARLVRLHRACREVLRAAIRAGGTTLRDFRDVAGDLGYFAVELRAYDREGLDCARCEGTVRRIVLGGRATFYCPGCQR